MEKSIKIIDNKPSSMFSALKKSKKENGFQSDRVLFLRFLMTIIGEMLTICLFLIQKCDIGNPLLVQVMIVWPFFMGLTLLVFIIFNFIDNFILDFPTAEEVAALASQHQAKMLPGLPQKMLLQQPNNQR